MSFLMIKFETKVKYERLCEELSRLGCFQVDGDWHEHCLRNVPEAGLTLDCAPAKSVIEDKIRNGNSLYISIVLENGAKVTGQLRQTSLLVSAAKMNTESLAGDGSIAKVVSCFKRYTRVNLVEVG